MSSDDGNKKIQDEKAITFATSEKDVLDESNDDGDDMESLLPRSTGSKNIIGKGDGSSLSNTSVVVSENSSSPLKSLDIDTGDNNSYDNDDVNSNSNNNDDTEEERNNTTQQSKFCCGVIKGSRTVGNMRILFPDYFHSSGWGVLGPHSFGPVCVWLILLGATHGCIKGINKHGLGIYSVIICYIFLGLSTYRLTDVSYRDPGICLDREIPGHETPERASQYRFCDRCKVWQPPDGVHCPECNVCIKGYDHHCVWIGTCIGKRNYRQFVLFNMMWLYYVGYAFFWILAIGPLISTRH